MVVHGHGLVVVQGMEVVAAERGLEEVPGEGLEEEPGEGLVEEPGCGWVEVPGHE